jgi:hypothetical protein
MFNNLEDKFTYELSTRRVDGSSGVEGRGKQWRWTVQRIAMLQEVISYAVKQCLKLDKLNILR